MLYKNNHKMNPGMLKSTSQTSSAPNEQQMLAQALRGNGGMPQQQPQFSEEEKMMIMQLMQQGMTQEQAMQELMRMKSVA